MSFVIKWKICLFSRRKIFDCFITTWLKFQERQFFILSPFFIDCLNIFLQSTLTDNFFSEEKNERRKKEKKIVSSNLKKKNFFNLFLRDEGFNFFSLDKTKCAF